MIRCSTCKIGFGTLGQYIIHGLKEHEVTVEPIKAQKQDSV